MMGFETRAQAAWMIILWLAWAGLLFGGFIFGRGDARRMPAWTRLASSLVLVIAGWSWYAFTRAELALLVAAGMTLGFVGDLFLARWLRGPNPLLCGLSAFGLGHIFYVAAFLRFGRLVGLNRAALLWLAWGVWLLIGVIGWYGVVWRARPAKALRGPALIYVGLLASTAGVALGVALQTPAFISVAIGGALFFISDLVLAADLFRGVHFKLMHDLIWLTYGPAQMLIVMGSGAAALALI